MPTIIIRRVVFNGWHRSLTRTATLLFGETHASSPEGTATRVFLYFRRTCDRTRVMPTTFINVDLCVGSARKKDREKEDVPRHRSLSPPAQPGRLFAVSPTRDRIIASIDPSHDRWHLKAHSRQVFRALTTTGVTVTGGSRSDFHATHRASVAPLSAPLDSRANRLVSAAVVR